MSLKEAFQFKLTTMSIVLIPVAVGINFVGKSLAKVLALPMWLDSIGTILAAILAGPWVGAISGAANNIFFGFTEGGFSFWYGITSIAIAIVAGILAHAGWFQSIGKAILAGIVLAFVSSIVSTPINVFLWGGLLGVPMGDAVIAALQAANVNIWIASFAGELLLDLIDKIAVAIIVYFIALSLPKRFTQGFKGSNQTMRY